MAGPQIAPNDNTSNHIGPFPTGDTQIRSNTVNIVILRTTDRGAIVEMKTDNAVQSVPFGGRRQSLIEDARKERAGGAGGPPSPGPHGDHPGFETKDERVVLNVVVALSNEKNSGFFKTGKIFEVSKK